jgi:serine/threonine protein kinase
MEAPEPVRAGSRFGPYEILSSLGAGGMGEVYRARDQRLDRIVALKILAPHQTGDPEFRDRLRREARALSRLSHPHVCAVFDVGTEGGRDYFVMELLSGETLAARLARGPLSFEEAVRAGVQIAGALESSHRAGVIHRDLKPANVMLTPSGVKLLDFGIARFAPAAAAAFQQTATAAVASHDTLSGTLQYMAPEQLEGRDADARSDIFSFGALLYEMITGRRAFDGESPARVTAAILGGDPPAVSVLRPDAPQELDRLIRTCLVKDPVERWQNAHDLRLELEWIAERPREPLRQAAPRLGSQWMWIAAVAVAGLAAGALIASTLRRDPEVRPTIRAEISPPPGIQYMPVGTQGGPAVISPDGTRLAFAAAGADGRARLWVRAIGSVVAQPLEGTDNGSFPFWSPDGQELGFFADRKLKKIDIASTTVTPLCDAPFGGGGTWSRNGTIVFRANSSNPGLTLQRVSDRGGSPAPATTIDPRGDDLGHVWPAFLPDGNRFLYAARKVSGTSRIRMASLDSTRVDDVLEADSNAEYANGFVLFVRKGTLLAQRLDDGPLRLAGEPVPLAERVLHDVNIGRAVFSVSERGSLVYQAGSAVLPSRLVWLDRNGNPAGSVDDACFCAWPRLDPQAKRAAVTITHPGTANPDLHVYHFADGRRERLTFDESYDGHAAWTADGNRIVFDSNRRGVSDLYWIDAGGRTAAEPLFASNHNKYVTQLIPGGVVFREDQVGEADRGHWLLPLTQGAKPQQVRLNQPGARFGAVSPDGRWLAYEMNEGDSREIFVTSFPGLTGNWPISQDGGFLPRWSRDGREIFYLTQDHATMYAVRINEAAGVLRPSRPERLFTTQLQVGRGYPYDVAGDGRFLAVVASGSTNAPLTLVVDWPSDLRR